MTKKFKVEVRIIATSMATVYVEAENAIQAVKKAQKMHLEPDDITDSNGNAIEGIGDIHWVHDGVDTDSYPVKISAEISEN